MIELDADDHDLIVRLIERKLSFINEAFLTERHYEAVLSWQSTKMLLRSNMKDEREGEN